MLKALLACLVAAAPAAIAAQSPVNPAPANQAPANPAASQSAPAGEWTVAGGAGGCIAHSASAEGTVVSILAAPGQSSLLFVVQNRGWSSLEDGAEIPLAVQLDGGREWKFEAVAKTELDEDGPGYLFVVPPTAPFLAAFADASGMALGGESGHADTVTLRDGAGAMAGLAQCISHMSSGAAPAEAGAPTFIRGTGKAVKL